MTLDTILKNINVLKNEDRFKLFEELKSSIKSLRIKKFTQGDERPCKNSDFATEKKDLENSVNILKVIIENLVHSDCFTQSNNSNKQNVLGNNNPYIDNELLAFILIICGENISLKPWNTETTVKTCGEILAVIFKLFECDISQLIMKDYKRNFVRDVLEIIRPNLLASTWKNFPATVIFYEWFLKKINQPKLSDHLIFVLPTALLLVDDFVTDNKITGVKCLHHIVNNVTVAELQFHGHGDVIYNALMPLLRIREADLISCTIPCLVHLTTKLEKDFGKKNVAKWSRFDNITEIILENMEMEQQLDLRYSYIFHLKDLIKACNFGITRWSKRLLRIFREYLEVGGKHEDEGTVNYCLKAIQVYAEITESVAVLYAEKLFFILLVALHNTANSTSKFHLENTEITTELLKKNLLYFSETDKNNFKKELQDKLEENNFSNFYQVINLLFEDC